MGMCKLGEKKVSIVVLTGVCIKWGKLEEMYEPSTGTKKTVGLQ